MITLSAKGLKALQELAKDAPELIDVAAMRAVNYALVKVRTRTSNEMRSQVELKKQYIDENLKITRKATRETPSGEITGEFDPITLARFARGVVRRGKAIGVRVKKGSPTTKFSNAAIIKLAHGGIGFLVRVKKGETLRGSKAARELKPRMRKDGTRPDGSTKAYLLYGPSVNQMFNEMIKTGEVTPYAGDILEEELFRQIKVLASG